MCIMKTSQRNSEVTWRNWM
uniref:Uncharacterized protein n=1 Tax=Anguilla anguilla TaxID=7936 RepID=A0A0E9Q7Y9_ANGAN